MNKDRDILKKQIKEAVGYDFIGKENILEDMVDVMYGKNSVVINKNKILVGDKLFKLKYKIKYFFSDIFCANPEAKRMREVAFNIKKGKNFSFPTYKEIITTNS